MTAPLWETPAAGEFQCAYCLEISPTRYMHELNHHPMGSTDICVSQWLRSRHGKYEAPR